MEEQKLENEKKKIRGNEQTGVLIALDPKKRRQTVLLLGLSKSPVHTPTHCIGHPQGALRPPTTRGNQSLNCTLDSSVCCSFAHFPNLSSLQPDTPFLAD